MGCWNQTCAVTNLPIYRGEEVVVMLLQEASRRYSPNYCYTTGLFVPYPFTFRGKYNDYGSVEDWEGEAIDVLLSHIRQNLVELELGSNEYHDIEVKADKLDMALLFEADHESRLYVKDNYNEHSRVKSVMIRKSTWDGVVKQTPFVSQYGAKEMFYNDLLLQVDDFMATIQQPNLFAIGDVFSNTELAKLLSDPSYTFGFSVTAQLIDEIKVGISKERLTALIENAIQSRLIHRFMDNGRISYSIPAGEGSQDDSTQAQLLRAQLTIDEAKKLEGRWEDD